MEYLDTWLLYIPQSLKVLICLILGLIIGSFLNVVIYRLPIILNNKYSDTSERFNLLLPPSHCPSCKALIPIWSNIPVLGYLLLSGKCIKCNHPISLRYLFVELLTGLLFTLYSYPVVNVYLLFAGLIFISFCICAIFIDYETYLLPDEITLPLIWIGLFVNLNGMISGSLFNSVVGAMTGYLSLWGIFWSFKLITKKDGMGYGDFKFLAAILAFLGIKAIIPVTLFASMTGIFYAIIIRLFYRKLSKHSVEIPFGPFLGIAAILFLIINQYYQIEY